MPITPRNLVRHELIGLEVEVAESSNRCQVGIKGRVVDESRQMLVIETSKGEKKIEKKSAVFIFKLPSGVRVQVDGKLLVGRPEDRIKKKLPTW